jgi:hypothetical protein
VRDRVAEGLVLHGKIVCVRYLDPKSSKNALKALNAHPGLVSTPIVFLLLVIIADYLL